MSMMMMSRGHGSMRLARLHLDTRAAARKAGDPPALAQARADLACAETVYNAAAVTAVELASEGSGAEVCVVVDAVRAALDASRRELDAAARVTEEECLAMLRRALVEGRACARRTAWHAALTCGPGWPDFCARMAARPIPRA